jgi:hypothetical protein
MNSFVDSSSASSITSLQNKENIQETQEATAKDTAYGRLKSVSTSSLASSSTTLIDRSCDESNSKPNKPLAMEARKSYEFAYSNQHNNVESTDDARLAILTSMSSRSSSRIHDTHYSESTASFFNNTSLNLKSSIKATTAFSNIINTNKISNYKYTILDFTQKRVICFYFDL